MKILEVKSLTIPDIKIINFARFLDSRGYFTEVYKKSDFENHPDMSFLKNTSFDQCNESISHKGVIRGLHFQWNPAIGKLVKVTKGHIIDVCLDIRVGSPFFGKIVGYEMQAYPENEHNEWIWIPPGFAHGIFCLDETILVYFQTGEYSPVSDSVISPLAPDIDWSLFDPKLKETVDRIKSQNPLISDKDRAGISLSQWKNSQDAENFIYG